MGVPPYIMRFIDVLDIVLSANSLIIEGMLRQG